MAIWRQLFLAVMLAMTLVRPSAILAASATPVESAAPQVDPVLQQARDIDALIAGTLAADIDAEPLLEVSLVGEGAERAPFIARLANDGDFFERATADPAILKPLGANEALLALAQARFLRLPQAQREALLTDHARKGAEAAAAAEAQALSEAEDRRFRAARTAQIEQQEAALRRSREAQAQMRALIARLESQPVAISQAAQAWQRNVATFVGGWNRNRRGEADQMYDEIVQDLRSVRQRLREALDKGEMPAIAAVTPPALDSTLPLNSAVTRSLAEQHRDLMSASLTLRAAYDSALWNERHALREAMVLENEQRLALIPLISPPKRSELLGFGSAGVAQASREFQQIVLDLRFHVQEWHRFLLTAADSLLHPSPAFVISLLWLTLLVLLFRWWRSAGEGVLARSQEAVEARRPRTVLSSLQATVLTYVRRIRRPLDWFVFALLFRWLLPDELALVGIDLIWIVVFWSLLTLVLVRFADALAKGHAVEDPRASLRWRSLRLVAGSMLAIGLVLMLTSTSVGEGAIYHWVLAACWLIGPAIILILAHWWRERIVGLAAISAENSALLGWVGRDPGGIGGLVGRVLAGAVLLLFGLKTVISRRANDVALVRELFEKRARSRAAQQVAEDKASGRYRRPSAEVLEMLDPHRLPTHSRTSGERPGHFKMPDLRPGTLTLVVGERGMGKSALLRDLREAHVEAAGGKGNAIALRIGAKGLDGFRTDLVAALGLSDDDEVPDDLAQLLAALPGSTLVTVDDVQRLAVAAIGGLSDFDRLIDLARRSGPNCRWLFTMGGPAWSFVSRARAERTMFDEILRLPRWSCEELRNLIERRTAQAGIEPDFSGMIDEGTFHFGGEVDPDVRRRLGYFEELSDYADGNPAVALEYWRRSLFIDDLTGRVMVRTFARPKLSRLAALPPTAMFVLRAIVQMDSVDMATIRRSTDLPVDVVADALRGLTRLGTVAETDGTYRVQLYWWIEAMRLLRRQNLIMRDGA